MRHLQITPCSESNTDKLYPINITWDNCLSIIDSICDIPGIIIEQEDGPDDPYLIHIPSRKAAYEAILALNREINDIITHTKDREYFDNDFYNDGIQDIWDAQKLINTLLQHEQQTII